MSTPDYELSANQKKFVDDAETQGVEVDYTYSGRGMFGKCCPGVRLDDVGGFGTKAHTSSDSMGLGFVVYARS